MFVCCECRVLSGRGLCDELITPPQESYRLWCIIVCDLETSRMRRPWPSLGRSATAKKKTLPFPILSSYSMNTITAVCSVSQIKGSLCMYRNVHTPHPLPQKKV